MSHDSDNDLGQSLRQLKVTAPSLDRDRLLFEAGRRSVRHSWAWPLATAASVLLAVSTGFLYWHQFANIHEQAKSVVPTRPETVASPVAQREPVESISPLSYLAMRNEDFGYQRVAMRSSTIEETKPMPILSAGSYVLPEWQR